MTARERSFIIDIHAPEKFSDEELIAFIRNCELLKGSWAPEDERRSIALGSIRRVRKVPKI